MLALRAVRRFKERSERIEGWDPPVSVLKPVCGAEPGLYECLRSFCEQDWPVYEVIFGAHSEDDPAVAVVRRLIAEFPDRDLRLVIDGALAGPNRKAANLANIFASARHDIIVLSDGDVRVDRDCLASMAAPFAEPSVGAVAAIYKGWAVGGAAARFGALYINDWFVPSVVVDVDLRGIDFVFGAMSAVRRQPLEAIGGFEYLAQCLAEDFSMGRLISRNGVEGRSLPLCVRYRRRRAQLLGHVPSRGALAALGARLPPTRPVHVGRHLSVAAARPAAVAAAEHRRARRHRFRDGLAHPSAFSGAPQLSHRGTKRAVACSTARVRVLSCVGGRPIRQ